MEADPRVVRATRIIAALREQLEKADERAVEMERQSERAKASATLRISKAIVDAQQRADGVVKQARDLASRRIARAGATVGTVRAERRRMILQLQEAITATLDDEDRLVGAARGGSRALILEKLKELTGDLGEPETHAGNGHAAARTALPPEPVAEAPTISTVAIRVESRAPPAVAPADDSSPRRRWARRGV